MKSHPVWSEFRKFVLAMYDKSGCERDAFSLLYPTRYRPWSLMSDSDGHGSRAWRQIDVDNLIKAIGSHLSNVDVPPIQHVYEIACSIAKSNLLPETDASLFVNQGREIDWRLIEDIGEDHAQRFVATEALLRLHWQPVDMKRLRDLMHFSKKRLSTFQIADRLFLALMAISGGLMPTQARGSLDYMFWFHEMVDGWIEHKMQRSIGGIKLEVKGTEYEKWDLLEFGSALILIDYELCQDLSRMETIPFSKQDDRFYVKPSSENQLLCGRALYEAFTSEKKRAFNERKIRLCADLTRASLTDKSIGLQATDYYSQIATNQSSSTILYSRADGRCIRGDSFCTENGTMRSLASSLCSNQIGINTLAFTKDGYLGLHIQTEDNLVGEGLAPSCSGSLDLEDADETDDLVDLIIRGVMRELAEESLVFTTKRSTQIMGYALAAHRGYKPEFFAVTKLEMTYNDLRLRHVHASAEIEEFVGPPHYAEIGESASEAETSISRLLSEGAITVHSADDLTIHQVPLGNILRLMLELLLTHLTNGSSVVRRFLFSSE